MSKGFDLDNVFTLEWGVFHSFFFTDERAADRSKEIFDFRVWLKHMKYLLFHLPIWRIFMNHLNPKHRGSSWPVALKLLQLHTVKTKLTVLKVIKKGTLPLLFFSVAFFVPLLNVGKRESTSSHLISCVQIWQSYFGHSSGQTASLYLWNKISQSNVLLEAFVAFR